MSESALSEQAGAVAAGYAFEGAALELGRLVEAAQPDAVTAVDVKIPLAMLNRHGLIAGATGTGKTKTLQLLAEQLSAAGVPVFAADIEGRPVRAHLRHRGEQAVQRTSCATPARPWPRRSPVVSSRSDDADVRRRDA